MNTNVHNIISKNGADNCYLCLYEVVLDNHNSKAIFTDMITLRSALPLGLPKNPQYEEIFNPRHLDEDCDTIADGISVVGRDSEDEHSCYFDDMYSPEYALQAIYEALTVNIHYDSDDLN